MIMPDIFYGVDAPPSRSVPNPNSTLPSSPHPFLSPTINPSSTTVDPSIYPPISPSTSISKTFITPQLAPFLSEIMKDYTDLTMPELTAIVKHHGLPTDGVKDALISRLEEYDHTNNPTPSPQLHHSPASSKAQTKEPKSTPVSSLLLSGNDHPASDLPANDLSANDEVDYANWEEEYGDVSLEAIKVDKAATAGPSIKFNPVTKDGLATPKSDPAIITPPEAATVINKNTSQSSLAPTTTYAPVEVTTKSGFKYKSLAATFYADTPKVPTPTIKPNGLSKAASKASSDSLEALPKTSTTTTIAATTIAAMTSSPPEGNTHIKSPVETVRTTKSGFKFNSIASLFSTDSTVSNTDKSSPTPLTCPPTAAAKPQSIENVVVDTDSTYSIGLKLDDKDEQAKKLALRAKRFGIDLKDEVAAATKTRREARFGPSEVVDDLEAANKERARIKKAEVEKEKEKEREREKVRQRVSGGNNSGKRKRPEGDDDKHHERVHRYNRQQQHRPLYSNYGRRHRYN